MGNDDKTAKPFLKWAGGKKQIKNCIERCLPQQIKADGEIGKYFEPFLGGGAIFFHLVSKFDIDYVYLSDINKDLILTYKVVKKEPKGLIKKLNGYSKKFKEVENRRKCYEKIRDKFNENINKFDYDSIFEEDDVLEEHIVKASRMIFLNRTCFNGLYRVNKSGEFNVPMGSYKNPRICDKDNILAVSDILNKYNVDIVCKDYSKSEKLIDKDSFVYLDPPYFPIKKTSFTSYNSKDFGRREQIELSKFCEKIDSNGGKFLLSNSKPSVDFFRETYSKLDLKKCNHKTIEARRSINSNGNKRGAIKELLIFNY